MKRRIMREKDGQFCVLEIELDEREPGKPELSICGTAGRIATREAAGQEALDYWTSFFDENPSEKMRLIENEKRYMTDEEAASYVLAVDGEFHGLDVSREDGDKVYLADSFGQIREEIAEFFPEAVPYFKWHLNGMRAGCAHQQADIKYEIGAVCEFCGYKYGSAWLYEPLPADVIGWAKTFEAGK